jgi:hypothetical protein
VDDGAQWPRSPRSEGPEERLIEPDGWARGPSEACSALGSVQYSSARIIVKTGIVTAGSAGSGEPYSVFRS